MLPNTLTTTAAAYQMGQDLWHNVPARDRDTWGPYMAGVSEIPDGDYHALQGAYPHEYAALNGAINDAQFRCRRIEAAYWEGYDDARNTAVDRAEGR